jgi:hypothetical protein
MKAYFFIICFVLNASLHAQNREEKLAEKWSFAGIAQGGLLAGQSELNYMVQAIPAVQKGNWLLGIGAGIDHYVMPGIPVVAHGQYTCGRRSKKLFGYAQAGPHFPLLKNEWDDKVNGQPVYDAKTGWLGEAGIGFSIPLGKRMKIMPSLGYSIKQMQYTEMLLIWGGPFPFDREPVYYDNNMTLRRVVLKLGIGF